MRTGTALKNCGRAGTAHWIFMKGEPVEVREATNLPKAAYFVNCIGHDEAVLIPAHKIDEYVTKPGNTLVGHVVPGSIFQIEIAGAKAVRMKLDTSVPLAADCNSATWGDWKPVWTNPDLQCKVLGKISYVIEPIN